MSGPQIKSGMTLDLGAHTFTPDSIVAFAEKFDNQPFHLSNEAAAKTHFGGLSASGWQTSAVFSKLFVSAWETAYPELVLGHWTGMRDLKWVRPVRAGDTLRYSAHIAAINAEMMTIHGSALNQRGECAFSFEADMYLARAG